MRTSIFASYIMGQVFPTAEEGLRHMYNHGIRAVEMLDVMLSEYPLHLQLDWFREIGLEPASLVSTLDFVTADTSAVRRAEAAIKGYIDQLQLYKVPFLMLAPSVSGARDAETFHKTHLMMQEKLAAFVDYAKGSGVTIVIENQSVSNRPDSFMRDIRATLDAVPGLGYVLDTGNFYCVQEDILKAYELFKDRLVHVHFKDWRKETFGSVVRENMPRLEGDVLGEGILPLRKLAEWLCRDGYDGDVVLELNVPAITVDMLDRSAAFLNEVFWAKL